MGSIGKVEKRGVWQVNKALAHLKIEVWCLIINIVMHRKMGTVMKA